MSRAIRRDWIGTPKARLTVYLKSADHVEDTRGGIRHDVLLDEATLVAHERDETCVDVVVRTDSMYDEPIDQLGPMCSGVAGTVASETVSVLDYAYVGSVEKMAVEGVAATAFLGLSISEPGEKTFRVIERKARVCCATPVGKSVVLSLKNKRMTYRNAPYSQKFTWQLQ